MDTHNFEQMKRPPMLPAKHPGVIFKQRFLEKTQITNAEAAKKMNLTGENLILFAVGQIDVDNELALKLESITGLSSVFWIQLQTNRKKFETGTGVSSSLG